MVGIPALWLPIVLSAVIVFVASSILHMALKYHHGDYKRLPNEDAVLEALAKAGVTPGTYAFPCAPNPKERTSPEMIEKFKKGPVGLMNVIASGPPSMPKYLIKWFLFTVLVGVFAAYLAGRTLGPGAEYLAVFRVTGTTALIAYAAGQISHSIWMGQPWSITLKHSFDGLIYALLTGGTFGWLWPA